MIAAVLLRETDVAFLWGVVCGVVLTFFLTGVALSMLDAVRAWREGNDE